MENKKKTNLVWIIIIISLSIFFVIYGSMNGEIVYINETNEPKYITKYTWNKKDIKTFYNTYYVDRGYENEPIEMQYVLLRCEIEEGDLEVGTYHFETDKTIGATFLIYIVDNPIDLNTYDGNQYEQIVHNNVDHTTKDLEIKQGQYIYIQAGFNPKGTMTMEKRQ